MWNIIFNESSLYWALTALAAIFTVILFWYIIDYILGRRFISNISDRYVFITGCDTGFGELACRRLDSMGCHVVAGCLTDELVKNIEKNCSRVKALRLDVTQDKSVEEAVVQVTSILPAGTGLWGIVNNAGEAGNLGPLDWCSMSDFENLLNTNFIGQLRVIKAFLPLMKKGRDGGRIVNTSSILGLISIPYAGPYCISKHAIEAMTEALRLELLPYNIRVSLVEPGTHKTPFLTKIPKYLAASWSGLSTEVQQEYGEEYMKHGKTLKCYLRQEGYPALKYLPHSQNVYNLFMDLLDETRLPLVTGNNGDKTLVCVFVTVLFLGTRLIPLLGRSDLSSVINSYTHALFSQRPRRRYIVGYDALLLLILSWLPSWIKDLAFSLPGLHATPKVCCTKKFD